MDNERSDSDFRDRAIWPFRVPIIFLSLRIQWFAKSKVVPPGIVAS